MLNPFFLYSNQGKKDSLAIIYTNQSGAGLNINLEFIKGKKHSHALIAVWMEDVAGNYIQTLFISKSIGSGYYEHGLQESDKWIPGEVRRPAALPYWAFKRGVKEKDGLYIPTPLTAVPDSYTGATPKSSFILKTRTDQMAPEKFRILFEINQAFDFNEYWTTVKYPEDTEYHTSAQPSLIYSVEIYNKNPEDIYYLHLIGHGHYSGLNGNLFTNTGTLTTALEIVKTLTIKIIK